MSTVNSVSSMSSMAPILPLETPVIAAPLTNSPVKILTLRTFEPFLHPLLETIPVVDPCVICSPDRKSSVVFKINAILEECLLCKEESFQRPDPLNSISTFLVTPIEFDFAYTRRSLSITFNVGL